MQRPRTKTWVCSGQLAFAGLALHVIDGVAVLDVCVEAKDHEVRLVHRRERNVNRLKSFNISVKHFASLDTTNANSNLECLVSTWRELYIALLCPTITSPATCHLLIHLIVVGVLAGAIVTLVLDYRVPTSDAGQDVAVRVRNDACRRRP